MVRNLYTEECCPPSYHSPILNACFVDSIIEGYEKLEEYGQLKFGVPKERIALLALPRYCRTPFKPKCACKFQFKAQIIYKDPPFRLHRRSEQLALPFVRTLLIKRKEVAPIFSKERMAVLTKLTRKSLFSTYANLMNSKVPPCVHPGLRKDPIIKNHYAKLRKYLEARSVRLAEPKEPIQLPEIVRKMKGIGRLMPGILKLSMPKNRYDYVKPEWVFTKAMKNHKASPNEQKLSKPKIFDKYEPPHELPIRPSPAALKYKISPRVTELSEPKALRMGESDLKENPFAVVPNALKYKITKRMKDLAEPKEYPENIHIRQNPEFISPTALTYKASARIMSLAEPKAR